MLKLTDLAPRFVQYGPASIRWAHERPEGLIPLTFAEAEGVMFLCPACFQKNGGARGTHVVDVTFADRGVPDDRGSHGTGGNPTRWTVTGTGFDDLTTTPSILLIGGCAWHGFLTNGSIQ